jgi:hypothetical protein
VGGNRPEENKNLSQLSFDERMAYYKQKYDDGSKPAADRKQGGENRRNTPSSRAKNETVQNESAKNNPPAKPDKKGIISRIFGIFRKE